MPIEKSEMKKSDAALPFGKRLQTAREALSLTPKDVASQLRLNEQIIMMLEKQEFPASLPFTYIYGYIRVYGKLLELPEAYILDAINDLKSKTNDVEPISVFNPIQSDPVPIGKYLIRFITSFIVCMTVGVGGMYWYKHDVNTETLAQNEIPTTNIMYADNNTLGGPLLTMDNNNGMTTILSAPQDQSSQPSENIPKKTIIASKSKTKKIPVEEVDDLYIDDVEQHSSVRN